MSLYEAMKTGHALELGSSARASNLYVNLWEGYELICMLRDQDHRSAGGGGDDGRDKREYFIINGLLLGTGIIRMDSSN